MVFEIVFEMVQKRAMRITFPWTSYTDALSLAGLQQLDVRRDKLTKKLFQEIIADESHRLHGLLPPRNNTCNINLRSKHKFNVTFRTDRFKNSFIIHNALTLDNWWTLLHFACAISVYFAYANCQYTLRMQILSILCVCKFSIFFAVFFIALQKKSWMVFHVSMSLRYTRYTSPTSHFPSPTSHVRLPTSHFQSPTSHFTSPTSHFTSPTSHFTSPTWLR